MALKQEAPNKTAEEERQERARAVARELSALRDEEKDSVQETVTEIQSMDTKTELILRQRSGKIADEIQKLRAGRQFRDTNGRWS